MAGGSYAEERAGYRYTTIMPSLITPSPRGRSRRGKPVKKVDPHRHNTTLVHGSGGSGGTGGRGGQAARPGADTR
ncbi:hypothetical protein E2C01_077952 [Portunus trituberculatus]|uniref:Uncharacterized protein n=1 Tax=Portunus trituberculatus TaxID=210409 RepID=A0A5B7INR4_PORTR|nr:hypothetical protein [Portunus trituberculatus]